MDSSELSSWHLSGPRAVLSRTVHPPPAVGVKLRVRSGIFGFSTAWLRRVEFEFAVHIPRRGVPWTPPGTCRVSSAAHHTFPANAPTPPMDSHRILRQIAEIRSEGQNGEGAARPRGHRPGRRCGLREGSRSAFAGCCAHFCWPESLEYPLKYA